MKKYFPFFISIFSILIACNSPVEPANTEEKSSVNKKKEHFSIEEYSSYILLEIREPFQGSGIVERYVLYPRGTDRPKLNDITHFIETPVERIGITSTTHMGYLNALQKSNNIKAIVNPKLFYDTLLKARITKEKVRSIGSQSIDQELLIQSELDVLFDYAVDHAAFKKIEQLRKLGQTIIPIAEYMEQDPIAKMQWLKVFAGFFEPSDLKKALAYIDSVDVKYGQLKTMAQSEKERPTVMIGYPWQGNWYVSGGDSFQAKYFSDANVSYIWHDTKQTASIALSVEKVLKDALEADFWLNPGIIQSRAQLIESDPRFGHFKAFKENQVFTNYNKSDENGANDYWESAVVRPDRVLLDLMTIFHPKLTAGENLYYFKKIEE